MRMATKICYLVHGFNVSDGGEKTTDTLRPYAEQAGYRVVEFDYRHAGLLSVRLCDKKLAMAFSNLAEPGSIAIGHSNGCAIVHLAAQYGAQFDQVVYINPALNRDAELAPQVRAAHVWHSPSDKPVRLARWLPNHVWGKMGATGYTGEDERYINYNKEHDYGMISRTHSDVFSPEILAFYGPRIFAAL